MTVGPSNQVLIAIETLSGGGAERVALDLVRHWPRDHAEPVLLLSSRCGQYVNDLPSDLEVLEIGVRSSPRLTFSFIKRLRALLLGRRVIGVISHMTAMNRMLLRAALVGVIRAPVVVVEHNNFSQSVASQRMSPLRAFLLRTETGMLYRRAHAVVGCSQGVARHVGGLFRISPEKLHGIPNPLDQRFLKTAVMNRSVAAWFSRLPRPVFISVGRMVPQKGFDDLVRAFALQAAGSLVILGEGPLRGKLEALAVELGVAERVVMPGFLHGPEQVLQSADLYVSSSLSEGYPLALIEAYASGLPVVARACDYGPEEIITSDRPGFLVKSLKVSDLADAMSAVASSIERFVPGTLVDLSENDAAFVAQRYRRLFQNV